MCYKFYIIDTYNRNDEPSIIYAKDHKEAFKKCRLNEGKFTRISSARFIVKQENGENRGFDDLP